MPKMQLLFGSELVVIVRTLLHRLDKVTGEIEYFAKVRGLRDRLPQYFGRLLAAAIPAGTGGTTDIHTELEGFTVTNTVVNLLSKGSVDKVKWMDIWVTMQAKAQTLLEDTVAQGLDPLSSMGLTAMEDMLKSTVGGMGLPDSAVEGPQFSVQSMFEPLKTMRLLMGPNDMAVPGNPGVKARKAMNVYVDSTLQLAAKQLGRVLSGHDSSAVMPSTFAVNTEERQTIQVAIDDLKEVAAGRRRWGGNYTNTMDALSESITDGAHPPFEDSGEGSSVNTGPETGPALRCEGTV